jgi:stress response protein YsnF
VTYEEGLDADEQQVKTGEIGIEQQVETQTAYILVPVDKQRVGERNISADTEASLRAERAQQTKNLNID